MLHSRRFLIFVLLACFVLSLACVVYPVYVIRPFRAQGPRELSAALLVTRYRGIVTILSALAALIALAGYCRLQPNRWRRVAAAIAAVLVCALALAARVNIYEMMFHPMDHASFAAAGKSKLADKEKVIAVIVNGQARAYPIRILSYHHMMNDEVGKTAIVATY